MCLIGSVPLLAVTECITRLGRIADSSIQTVDLHIDLLLQSFEPPSTRMVAPVIHRASSDARKATTQDVLRLAEPFQRLYAESIFAARIRFGQARHVSLDDAWRNGVHANAATAEHGGEMLHQRVDCALCRGISRQGADGGPGPLAMRARRRSCLRAGSAGAASRGKTELAR
jgi:hypothetical protein